MLGLRCCLPCYLQVYTYSAVKCSSEIDLWLSHMTDDVLHNTLRALALHLVTMTRHQALEIYSEDLIDNVEVKGFIIQ